MERTAACCSTARCCCRTNYSNGNKVRSRKIRRMVCWRPPSNQTVRQTPVLNIKRGAGGRAFIKQANRQIPALNHQPRQRSTTIQPPNHPLPLLTYRICSGDGQLVLGMDPVSWLLSSQLQGKKESDAGQYREGGWETVLSVNRQTARSLHSTTNHDSAPPRFNRPTTPSLSSRTEFAVATASWCWGWTP